MGATESQITYDRETMIFDKKIHQKVLCASLIGLKWICILPVELIHHIIGDINDLLYFYVIQDAISHGWTSNTCGKTRILFPPQTMECHSWAFHGVVISFDASCVPHWIFDTEVRRDTKQKMKKKGCETKNVLIHNLAMNKNGYPDWIDTDYHSQRFYFPGHIDFNRLKKIQFIELVQPNCRVTIRFDSLNRIHTLENFLFRWPNIVISQ